jgi:hypothetical protein
MTPQQEGDKVTTDKLLLPDFIIIGAMKCGTTTLYRYLSEHPQIEMSREKETDFFVSEKNWDKGIDWYCNQFTRGDLVRGEASPNYTKCRDFAGVPDRMVQFCPDARLIYIVRDPVKRAESQFRHSFIMGTLDPELEGFADSHEYKHIMDASHYARQLDAYYEHYPKESILVLDFDDLVRDPQSVMDEITTHIGVGELKIQDIGAQNDSSELSKVPAPILRFAQTRLGRNLADLVSRETRDRIRRGLAFGKSRKAPDFPPDLIDRMRRDLAEDAKRFRELTGRPFSSWSV